MSTIQDHFPTTARTIFWIIFWVEHFKNYKVTLTGVINVSEYSLYIIECNWRQKLFVLCLSLNDFEPMQIVIVNKNHNHVESWILWIFVVYSGQWGSSFFFQWIAQWCGITWLKPRVNGKNYMIPHVAHALKTKVMRPVTSFSALIKAKEGLVCTLL